MLGSLQWLGLERTEHDHACRDGAVGGGHHDYESDLKWQEGYFFIFVGSPGVVEAYVEIAVDGFIDFALSLFEFVGIDGLG